MVQKGCLGPPSPTSPLSSPEGEAEAEGGLSGAGQGACTQVRFG